MKHGTDVPGGELQTTRVCVCETNQLQPCVCFDMRLLHHGDATRWFVDCRFKASGLAVAILFFDSCHLGSLQPEVTTSQPNEEK